MKKAHKIIALVAIMAMGIGSAQAQLSLGVKGGFNLSKMQWVDGNTKTSTDWLPGFNIGLMVEFGLSDMLTIEADALFSRKGCKREWEAELLGVKTQTTHTFSPFYVDVPVNLKAYIPLGGGLKLFAQAGPYVGFGIFGKDKVVIKTEAGGSKSESTNKEDLRFGSDNNDDLKMLDFGADVGAGIEFDKIQIGLMYWQGLANVAVSSAGGSKLQHRVLSLELGYKF